MRRARPRVRWPAAPRSRPRSMLTPCTGARQHLGTALHAWWEICLLLTTLKTRQPFGDEIARVARRPCRCEAGRECSARRNIQEQRQLPEWQTRDAVIQQKTQQVRTGPLDACRGWKQMSTEETRAGRVRVHACAGGRAARRHHRPRGAKISGVVACPTGPPFKKPRGIVK